MENNAQLIAQCEARAKEWLSPAFDEETRKDVQAMLDNADKTIILDCTNLDYISSSGLRLFLTIRKESSAKGGKVIIENINEEIRKVFMMTGFFNLFEIRNA